MKFTSPDMENIHGVLCAILEQQERIANALEKLMVFEGDPNE